MSYSAVLAETSDVSGSTSEEVAKVLSNSDNTFGGLERNPVAGQRNQDSSQDRK